MRIRNIRVTIVTELISSIFIVLFLLNTVTWSQKLLTKSEKISFLVIGYRSFPSKTPIGLPSEMAICKYNENGVPDSAFGKNGRIVPQHDIPKSIAESACAVDKEGNIFVTGKKIDGKKETMILWKYTPRGILDKSFGKKGHVVASLPKQSLGMGVVVDREGCPLVTGWTWSDTMVNFDRQKVCVSKMALWKFTCNGSPDTSFAGTGYVTYARGNFEHCHGFTIRTNSSNEIYLLGMSKSQKSSTRSLIWKYSSSGNLQVDPQLTNSCMLNNVSSIWIDNKDRLMVTHPQKVTRYPAGTPFKDYPTPDTTFGDYGTVHIEGFDEIDRENRIYFGRNEICRILENGLPDLTFRNSGCVKVSMVTKLDDDFIAYSVVILNKRDLVCGTYFKHAERQYGDTLIFWRYDSEESCIPEKNVLGNDQLVIWESINANDLTSTKDSCLLIAGTVLFENMKEQFYKTGERRSVVFRYKNDNKLDLSFGYNGFIVYPAGFEIEAVETDSAGNVYAIGNRGLCKHTKHGVPDSSFGSAGVFPHAGVSGYYSVTVRSLVTDERSLIVAGWVTDSNNSTHLALWRYKIEGSPDSSFGKNGVAMLEGVNSMASSVEIDNKGNILVGGQIGSFLMLSRFEKSGTLDRDFGDKGLSILEGINASSDGGDRRNGPDVTLDDQGRILITGTQNTGEDDMVDICRMITVRFNKDGSIDKTFGRDGIIYSNMADEGVVGKTLTVSADKKIFVAGRYFGSIVVWGYNQDGSPDTSFSDSGYVICKSHGPDITYTYGTDIIACSDGIYVLGTARDRHDKNNMILWRVPLRSSPTGK
ncbi:MAG TPA: hypothetical protein VHO70_06550 [Chitinispirillaceae bacterium]|nr:hypothetical protein [Chitinispirillaceae bacterium]